MGPAKLPPELTQRLNTEIRKVLESPEVVEKIASQGGEIVAGPADEFAAFLAKDTASWAELVKSANVKIE
jgi:tripartite-type tricarboxylate transporter receptor subunit TctC